MRFSQIYLLTVLIVGALVSITYTVLSHLAYLRDSEQFKEKLKEVAVLTERYNAGYEGASENDIRLASAARDEKEFLRASANGRKRSRNIQGGISVFFVIWIIVVNARFRARNRLARKI